VYEWHGYPKDSPQGAVSKLALAKHRMSWTKITWMEIWREIVRDFTGRQITYPSDQLPAVSALAQQINLDNKRTYIADLWLGDIHIQLQWIREAHGPQGNNSESEIPSAVNLPAPSWSWASRINQRIWTLATNRREVAYSKGLEVLRYDIVSAGNDPCGKVRQGTLHVRCRYLQATSWKGKHEPYFTKDGQQPWHGRKPQDQESHTTPLEDLSSNAHRLQMDQLVCYFDRPVYDDQCAKDILRDVTLAQIAGHCSRILGGKHGTMRHFSSLKIIYALMLIPTKDGTEFQRVGLCEVPDVGGLADGRDIKELAIV
jgi:hypothetical protein